MVPWFVRTTPFVHAGRRRDVLLRWLRAASETFPNATVRSDLTALRRRLDKRSVWNAGAYVGLAPRILRSGE